MQPPPAADMLAPRRGWEAPTPPLAILPTVPTDEPLIEPLQPPGIELHSIDYVPAAERHGTVRQLGALWFTSSVNLTGLATGITTEAAGAGLVWTLVATVLGSLFGTFFMAFHSAQGPQLGLPRPEAPAHPRPFTHWTAAAHPLGP